MVDLVWMILEGLFFLWLNFKEIYKTQSEKITVAG